jgi:hypothetical protein
LRAGPQSSANRLGSNGRQSWKRAHHLRAPVFGAFSFATRASAAAPGSRMDAFRRGP